ncbi:MAG: 5'-nucleotidase, partial [Acidobacteriota bacterium]
PVDASLPEDRKTAQRVRKMQSELEQDAAYRELFLPIGKRATPLSTAELATFTVETMRSVAGADIALSTRSSFRSPLPSGTLTMELLRAAMPYDNEIVTCTMAGPQLQRLLDVAGPDSITAGPPSIDPAKSYRVATTDYLANVAYKSVFDCDKSSSGLKVREEVRKKLVQ